MRGQSLQISRAPPRWCAGSPDPRPPAAMAGTYWVGLPGLARLRCGVAIRSRNSARLAPLSRYVPGPPVIPLSGERAEPLAAADGARPGLTFR